MVRAHKVYLVAAAAAICAYVVTPPDTWEQTIWFVTVALSGSAALLVGLRRHRPRAALAWVLFAAGLSLNGIGRLVETFSINVLHIDAMPSAADAFYLALYPGLAIGLVILIRSRSPRREWATVVDTTTVSTGLGLLSWVFLVRPAASDPTLGLLGHSVNVAYPVGDIVLLAMLVRLLLASGSKPAAYKLLTASLVLFLAGDVTWAAINQAVPGWNVPSWLAHLLDMNFLFAYVLPGVAALHPSVRHVAEPEASRGARVSPGLLVLLTAASLIAPGILAVEVARHEVTDGVAIVVGCVALFLLVVTRMAQLVRQVEAQARQLHELAQEDELTGLPNRRSLVNELPRAIERARRRGEPLAIAMLDLDHFKRFNDQFGHPTGDRLLKAATAAWRNRLRAVDELTRYGGEEFIVLLPGASEAEASEVLERLREGTPLGQTFSAGLASWDRDETSDELIARADAALYEAKRAGRNRIAVA